MNSINIINSDSAKILMFRNTHKFNDIISYETNKFKYLLYDIINQKKLKRNQKIFMQGLLLDCKATIDSRYPTEIQSISMGYYYALGISRLLSVKFYQGTGLYNILYPVNEISVNFNFWIWKHKYYCFSGIGGEAILAHSFGFEYPLRFELGYIYTLNLGIGFDLGNDFRSLHFFTAINFAMLYIPYSHYDNDYYIQGFLFNIGIGYTFNKRLSKQGESSQ